MKRRKNYSLILAVFVNSLLFWSCSTNDLFEKTASIPGHSWQNSYQPTFTFAITDTASPYNLFLVIRHSDNYNFNNIYVNLHIKQPATDSFQKAFYDLRLGTDNEGWLGSGMDDIYEHRILLTPSGTDFYFRMPGIYTFRLEQLMRENPLKHVLNAGLRIEKKL